MILGVKCSACIVGCMESTDQSIKLFMFRLNIQMFLFADVSIILFFYSEHLNVQQDLCCFSIKQLHDLIICTSNSIWVNFEVLSLKVHQENMCLSFLIPTSYWIFSSPFVILCTYLLSWLSVNNLGAEAYTPAWMRFQTATACVINIAV